MVGTSGSTERRCFEATPKARIEPALMCSAWMGRVCMRQRRTEQAMERIAREEARALQEVRAQAATLAIRTTEQLLADQLDGQRARALLDDAIAEVGQKLS